MANGLRGRIRDRNDDVGPCPGSLDRTVPEHAGDWGMADRRKRDVARRVVEVTAVEPGAVQIRVGVDDDPGKPGSPDAFRAVVDRLLERPGLDDRRQEAVALASKTTTFGSKLDVEGGERSVADDERRSGSVNHGATYRDIGRTDEPATGLPTAKSDEISQVWE